MKEIRVCVGDAHSVTVLAECYEVNDDDGCLVFTNDDGNVCAVFHQWLYAVGESEEYD